MTPETAWAALRAYQMAVRTILRRRAADGSIPAGEAAKLQAVTLEIDRMAGDDALSAEGPTHTLDSFPRP